VRSVLDAAVRLVKQAIVARAAVPSELRDRLERTLGPRLVFSHERPYVDVDEILAMYARGMSVGEIQQSLEARHRLGWPDQSSRLVAHDLGEGSWQRRPLAPMYPIVVFDAIAIRIRNGRTVENRDVYFALAVLPDGIRDILGLWVKPIEDATFWTAILGDLKARGCHDILIAVSDADDDVRHAMATVYPGTTLQTSIVSLIRNTFESTSAKERTGLAQAVRPIYAAVSANAARAALDDFERGPLGTKFQTIVASWRGAWEHMVPFFALPFEIRRVIYTTSALESVHVQLRRRLKTYGPLPNDQAATRLIWLLMNNIAAKWQSMVPNWKGAMTQFALRYEHRFAKSRDYS
jgi:putative transposase